MVAHLTKLIKIHCNTSYEDNGDQIKLEYIDNTASLSYSPTKRFKSNETQSIGAAAPAFGQVADVKLYVRPETFIGEEEVHVSTPSQGEKNIRIKKDKADYEITYEVV